MKYINLIWIIGFWTGAILLILQKDSELLDSRLLNRITNKCKDYLSNQYSLLKKRAYKKELKKELCDALSYIKNITILGNGKSISAVALLTDLSDFSDKLNPAFLSMARYLQVNDRENASKILGEVIETNIAKDIGVFLAGWEDINPRDILENIESYQSMIRNENLTESRSRDELISDLIYFPVIVNCMAILLNFVYISYYVQQQELFEFFL